MGITEGYATCSPRDLRVSYVRVRCPPATCRFGVSADQALRDHLCCSTLTSLTVSFSDCQNRDSQKYQQSRLDHSHDELLPCLRILSSIVVRCGHDRPTQAVLRVTTTAGTTIHSFVLSTAKCKFKF